MTWHIKTLVWQKSSDRDQNAPKVPDFRTHLTSLKFRMLWNLLRKEKFNRQFRASSVEVTKFKVAANSSEKLKRHDRVAKKIHSDETRVNTISMIHFLIRTESGFFLYHWLLYFLLKSSKFPQIEPVYARVDDKNKL